MNDNDRQNVYRAGLNNEDIHTSKDTAAKPGKPSGKPQKPLWIIAPLVLVAVALAFWLPGFLTLKDGKELFDEEGRSNTGLSDEDIRVIYRDFETKLYKKDASDKVVSPHIQGTSYNLGQMRPEERAALRDQQQNQRVYYNYESKDVETISGIKDLDSSRLEKRINDRTIWQVTLPFHMELYQETSDGVIAYGKLAEDRDQNIVAYVNDTGETVWQTDLGDSPYAKIYLVQPSDSGTIVVTHDGRDQLACLELSARGEILNRISVTLTDDVTPTFIDAIAKYGDGFVLVYRDSYKQEQLRLLHIDAEGHQTYTALQSEKDRMSYVTDLLAYGDKIYLSGYTTPMRPPDASIYYSEANDLFDYIIRQVKDINQDILTIESNDILPPLFRDYYTATLIEFEPDSGKPETFHQVPGAFGGELSIRPAGELSWDVENIESAAYYLIANSFNFRGQCSIRHFTFDQTGTFLRQEKNVEAKSFFR